MNSLTFLLDHTRVRAPFCFFAPQTLGLDTDPVTLREGGYRTPSLMSHTKGFASATAGVTQIRSPPRLGIQLESRVFAVAIISKFYPLSLSPLVLLSLNSGPNPNSGVTHYLPPFFFSV